MTDDEHSAPVPDLSPLRSRDPFASQERVVGEVMSRVRADAVRRGSLTGDAFSLLERRAMFILAAATIVGVIAGALLVRVRDDSSVALAHAAPPSVSAALGIDPAVAAWLSRPGAPPPAAEVFAAFRSRQ